MALYVTICLPATLTAVADRAAPCPRVTRRHRARRRPVSRPIHALGPS